MRRTLTRVGFAALGVVYIVLGALAIHVALSGARDRIRGFSGAFGFLLKHPFGPAVLVLIAAGLAGFTAARLSEAADGKRSFLARVASFADAIAHAAMGWIAVARFLRWKRGVDSRSALAWLLSFPWGATVLRTAGFVVIVIGALQLWQGLSGRLRLRPARGRLGGATADAVLRMGRFGYAARGIVSGIIGWFLVESARASDPRQYHDIGGALGVLQRTPLGPWLLGTAGAGLIAYGAYLFLLGLLGGRRPAR
ncbi:MAG: DUF1206 domain-containing protein [Acidobacteriota bacterium]